MVIRRCALRVLRALLPLLLLPAVVSAQPRPPGAVAVDRELERLVVEYDDGDGDLSLDDLFWLHEHPLDLRTVSSDDLAALPSLDRQAAIAIVDVVRRLQPRDLRTLASMLALSRSQLLALRAFTTLAVDTSARTTRGSVRVRVERELVERRGHAEHLRRIVETDAGQLDTIDVGSVYRGRPEALLVQMALTRGPVALFATVASDRGEPLVARDTSALAYERLERVSARDTTDVDASAPDVRTRLTALASASLMWERPWLTVIAGDFTAELGQGLVLADARRRSSIASGASSAYVAARRLAPYRSSDETAFLRGLAVEGSLERPMPFRLRGLGLVSWRWLDATLDSVTLDDGRRVPLVGSIRRDGYRRTMSEIRRSSNALERVAAANVALDAERWAVGLSAVGSDLRAEGGVPQPGPTVWSLDGRWSTRTTTLYAECALSPGPPAIVAGMIARAGARTIALAGRLIPVGARMAHGRAFPQSGAPSAERGVFASLELPIVDGLRASIGLDWFHRPEPSSTVPLPHSESQQRVRLEWRPAADLYIEGRLDCAREQRSRWLVDDVGRTHRGVVDADRTRFAIVLTRETGDHLTVRLRLDWRRSLEASEPPVDGWLSAVDARLRASATLEVLGGIAIFDAEAADVAMFIAEADLQARIRSVRLGGSGRRVFAALRWEPVEGLRVSASLGSTLQTDRRSLGDGLDAIDGPGTGSASLQFDWRIG